MSETGEWAGTGGTPAPEPMSEYKDLAGNFIPQRIIDKQRAHLEGRKLSDPDSKDPMQWWYDMTDAEQAAYTARQVELVREVCRVVGISGVASHNSWVTEDNPSGINAAVWEEYQRVVRVAKLNQKTVPELQKDLQAALGRVAEIELAISRSA